MHAPSSVPYTTRTQASGNECKLLFLGKDFFERGQTTLFVCTHLVTDTLHLLHLSRPASSLGAIMEVIESLTLPLRMRLRSNWAKNSNKTFGGRLVFPPEPATRLLTRVSDPASKLVGHSARFAFTGECFCLPPLLSPPSPLLPPIHLCIQGISGSANLHRT